MRTEISHAAERVVRRHELSECQKGSLISAFERAQVRRRACPELEEYAALFLTTIVDSTGGILDADDSI